MGLLHRPCWLSGCLGSGLRSRCRAWLLHRGGGLSGCFGSGLTGTGGASRLLRGRTVGPLGCDLPRSATIKSSIVATRIGPGARSPAILLGNGRGTVSDSLPMIRVMPPRPLAAASRGHVTHVPVPVYVIIDGNIPRHIDHHVVVMPVKAAPRIAPSDTDRHPDAKADSTARNHRSPRMIVVRAVCRPPPWAVNNHRIVYGYIDHLRNRGLDDDLLGLWIHDDALFIRTSQVTLSLGPLSELLDCVHHLVLLIKESVAQLLRPVKVVVHHLQDRGEVSQ